ncbi:hypothetical protein AB0I94_33820 [Streptomyces sp. NPDC050147]|uniref:hypothetical protein n=1 Tax=Streptomyces sp. NPDC050147 TaxID=3155513 RepID=UPI0034468EFA
MARVAVTELFGDVREGGERLGADGVRPHGVLGVTPGPGLRHPLQHALHIQHGAVPFLDEQPVA